jgi:hypothetical protein
MGLNAAAEASITIVEAVGDTRVDQLLVYFFRHALEAVSLRTRNTYKSPSAGEITNSKITRSHSDHKLLEPHLETSQSTTSLHQVRQHASEAHGIILTNFYIACPNQFHS